MMRCIQISIVLVCTFFQMGCSLEPPEKGWVRVWIDTKSSEGPNPGVYSSQGMGESSDWFKLLSAPSNLSGFSCLGINVMGPGIASSGNGGSGPELLNDLYSGRAFCSYPGVTSSPIALGNNNTIELHIPSGPARIIQMVGIANGASVCGSNAPLGTGGGNADYYEVARATADLFGDANFTLTNSFDSLIQTEKERRKLNCGETRTQNLLLQLASNTVAAGSCVSFIIRTQDGGGNSIILNQSITGTILGSNGTIYPSNCTGSSYSSFIIPAGSYSTFGYYSSTLAGAATVTAIEGSTYGFGSSSSPVTVNPGSFNQYQAYFPSTVTNSVCAPVYYRGVDTYGNSVNTSSYAATAVTFVASTCYQSPPTYYNASNCTGNTNNSFNFGANSIQSQTLYVTFGAATNCTITGAGGNGLSFNTVTLNIF